MRTLRAEGKSMKLYHYTTIETLALILSNRTLRFNNLKNVDDPTEGLTDDFRSLQNYIFVSCWTNVAEENLALWKMYAKSGAGVRIEVDSLDIRFEGPENPVTGINKIITNVRKSHPDHFYINFWQRRESLNPFFEINYSDKPKSFYAMRTEKHTQYNLESAICTKKSYWKFQSEIRFVMLGCTSKISEKYRNWQHIFNGIVSGEEFSDEHIDLELPESFIGNMKLVLGPTSGDSERIMVQALMSIYAKSNRNEIAKSVIELRRRKDA
jgi:hypothetical protein